MIRIDFFGNGNTGSQDQQLEAASGHAASLEQGTTAQGRQVGQKAVNRIGALTSLAAGVLAVGLLGACGVSTLTSGFGGSIFGGGKPKPQAGGSLTAESMLAEAKAGSASTGSIVGVGGDISYGCPKVRVLPRSHQLTIYEVNRVGDPLAVMHRGEITKTARECHVTPGQITIKYGFAGLVRLGPKGRTGSVTLPVQLSVTDANRQQVRSERMTVQAHVNLDNPIGYFSHVQSVTFQVPQGSRPGEFELQLGFVSSGQTSGLAPRELY